MYQKCNTCVNSHYSHPLYRRLAGFEKILIGFGEMLATEEAGIGGVRGGVRGFEDKVFAGVYQNLFLLGEFAPKKENDMLSFVRKNFDGGVGQFFPAQIAMRSGGIGANGQDGVEQ